MDKEYKQLKAEHNSKLSYCKYVMIGADTVFFTKNVVGHEHLDNYIMPHSLARSFVGNYALYPLYSIAIVCEKEDIIAITVWYQADGEQNDYLFVYNKTTGKLLSFTLIAAGGGGDCDVDVQMSLKNDSLIVYESNDCWHAELGYSYFESKKCFVVNSNGSVKEIVLLSAPEMFKAQTAYFTDKPAELRLFELIYMMPDKYIEKHGTKWQQDDRSLLYDNVKYEGHSLVKSHPQMKSIAYSNYNLETTIGSKTLNFHLYKANDGREFFVTSSVDSTNLSNRIDSYQYVDSCFVENNDFIPASLLGSNTDKHFSFDGDKLTITTSSSATTTYAFDKDKGSMTEIR
ncbi:MAG: hypothetical protein J6Y72_02575 [Bacteroidales bacterium]|nr:hypothetical protein [Bacteroidales bacterium]